MIRTSSCLVQSLFLVLFVLSLHRLPYPSGDSQSKCLEHKRKGNNVHTKIQQNPKDFQNLKPKTSSKTYQKHSEFPLIPSHISIFPSFNIPLVHSVRPAFSALAIRKCALGQVGRNALACSASAKANSLSPSSKQHKEPEEKMLKSWKEIRKSCPRFAKNVPGEFGCQGTIGAQHCSLFLFCITLLQMAQGCSIGTKSLYKQEENMNQYEIKTWCQTWSIRLTAFKG